IKERLEGLGCLIICLTVAGQHVHVLAKLPTGRAKELIGMAKRHAWFVLREYGWKEKLWGKRCKMVAVRDRGHQLTAYRYILPHAEQGAWVWASSDKG